MERGLCAYVLKLGPNMWSMPHFHDNDRFVTVLEGTFSVGTGKFDQQRTVPLRAGSFVRDIARGIHFEGTKDDGATLYVVGIGPSLTRPAAPGTTTPSGSGTDVKKSSHKRPSFAASIRPFSCSSDRGSSRTP